MSEQQKSILVIHANPNYAELTCSGTLKMLKEKGYRIIISTLTAGGLSGINSSQCKTIIARKKEAENAASLLGADYICFDQEEGFLFDNEKIRMDVAELIRIVNPQIIITHPPFDNNIDKRTTSNIVEIAGQIAILPNLQSKEPPLDSEPAMYYTAPEELIDPVTGLAYKPGFFVDIEKNINFKYEMISLHHSQIAFMKEMNRSVNYFEVMKEINLIHGKQAGCLLAEAFWQRQGGGYTKQPLLQNEIKESVIVLQ